LPSTITNTIFTISLGRNADLDYYPDSPMWGAAEPIFRVRNVHAHDVTSKSTSLSFTLHPLSFRLYPFSIRFFPPLASSLTPGFFTDTITGFPHASCLNPIKFSCPKPAKSGSLSNVLSPNVRIFVFGTFYPIRWLSVDITQKDNLVLDWYPADRFDPRAENDFKYWNDQWLPNSPPFNRLVMIREFGRLSSYIRLGKTGKAEQLLVEGILELLDHVADFASYFCEVSKDTWLFLEYDSRNSTMTKPLVLRSCNIRNVAEEKAREETTRKAAWLKEKFAENLGLEAITFLRAFEEANGSFPGTARVLKERYSARMEISGAKVKTLVNKLYEEYPDIYDKNCSVVPHGRAPRQKAQVLPFRRT
jgi:hypothetical protein